MQGSGDLTSSNLSHGDAHSECRMSTAQQENPSTYRRHHHINETLELFSDSSSSALSEELKLEVHDKADICSGGSSVDNPWSALPPTQPSSQPPLSNPFGWASGAQAAARARMTPIEAREAWLAVDLRRSFYVERSQAMGRAFRSSPTGFDSGFDSVYDSVYDSDSLRRCRVGSLSAQEGLGTRDHPLGEFAMPPPYEPISRSEEKNFVPSPFTACRFSSPKYRFYSDTFANDESYDLVVSPASPPRSRRRFFSRKVFVGGLPPDINEGGNLSVNKLNSFLAKRFSLFFFFFSSWDSRHFS